MNEDEYISIKFTNPKKDVEYDKVMFPFICAIKESKDSEDD